MMAENQPMTPERVEHLLPDCRRIVGSLRQRCLFPESDCDDLEQEMALELLQIEGGTDSYCLARAAWAALMWLRKTYSARLLGKVITLPDVTRLIDSGKCRRVWTGENPWGEIAEGARPRRASRGRAAEDF
jgi:hypothetical protein